MDTAEIGLGWSFPPSFESVEAGPNMKDGYALLNQAMYILLNTLLGERQFHTTYGSRLSTFMFSNVDAGILADIKSEVANAIMLNEPRVTLREVSFDSSLINEGQLYIKLDYQVVATQEETNFVFPYYLNDPIA